MRLLSPSKLSFITAIKYRILNWVRKVLSIWYRQSYSQLGEDIAIRHILQNDFNLNNGVYLDVGCNHPIIYSNTFELYLNNWTGIVIDINSELISLHKRERKKDIQINKAVSDSNEKVLVYKFDSHLINSINKEFYEQFKNKNQLVSEPKTVMTETLNQILKENNISSVDLLCIDVEGHDFKVLKSIDLWKYRPKLIVIEMHDFSFETLYKNEIYSYLKEHKYRFAGYLIANGYFTDETHQILGN